MASPKPIPTVTKRLNGNPGKRALNNNEPEPVMIDKLPDPPEWMGEYGATEWRRVGPHLIGVYLLTEADLMVFTTYCMNVQIMVESALSVRNDGLTIIGIRGRTRNPALTSFAAATTAIRSLATEFGMTPSSRSRIKLPGDDGETLADLAPALQDDEPE